MKNHDVLKNYPLIGFMGSAPQLLLSLRRRQQRALLPVQELDCFLQLAESYAKKIAPPRQSGLRHPLRCLGSFRSPRAVSHPSRALSADDLMLIASSPGLSTSYSRLANSLLDLFTFLQVGLHRLSERSFACVPWRVRINPILPKLQVFHVHLIHLKRWTKPRGPFFQRHSFRWKRCSIPHTFRHCFFRQPLAQL